MNNYLPESLTKAPRIGLVISIGRAWVGTGAQLINRAGDSFIVGGDCAPKWSVLQSTENFEI